MSSLSALQTDLSSLSSESQRRIAWAIEEAQCRERDEQKWTTLCDDASDAEIIEEARKCVISPNAAITLANRYSHVHAYQEIVAMHVHRHPRRPVAMKGGMHCMISRFGKSWAHCANGLAEHALDRYIRMSKLTAFDGRECDDALASFIARLRKKHHLTHHFSARGLPYNDRFSEDSFPAFVNGNLVFLSKSERAKIKALRAIIRKTENLDQRKRRAIALSKRRMAGELQ